MIVQVLIIFFFTTSSLLLSRYLPCHLPFWITPINDTPPKNSTVKQTCFSSYAAFWNILAGLSPARIGTGAAHYKTLSYPLSLAAEPAHRPWDANKYTLAWSCAKNALSIYYLCNVPCRPSRYGYDYPPTSSPNPPSCIGFLGRCTLSQEYHVSLCTPTTTRSSFLLITSCSDITTIHIHHRI